VRSCARPASTPSPNTRSRTTKAGHGCLAVGSWRLQNYRVRRRSKVRPFAIVEVPPLLLGVALVALTLALAMAAVTSQEAAAQCSDSFGQAVPCPKPEKQKRPTPTASPTPSAMDEAAQPALVIQPAPACTPDPSNAAACSIAAGGASASSLGVRPPSPNVQPPGPSLLGGSRLGTILIIVLIIAILLAIAIPTFLGARNTANVRSNQTNAEAIPALGPVDGVPASGKKDIGTLSADDFVDRKPPSGS